MRRSDGLAGAPSLLRMRVRVSGRVHGPSLSVSTLEPIKRVSLSGEREDTILHSPITVRQKNKHYGKYYL